MYSQAQVANQKKLRKKARFEHGTVLKDVRITDKQEPPHHLEQGSRPRWPQMQTLVPRPASLSQLYNNTPKGGKDAAVLLGFDGVPPLFRCKSREEICAVLRVGKGAISDIYRGYNALHWYCNAKFTRPSIVNELLRQGIDINAVDQRGLGSESRRSAATTTAAAVIIRHTALGFACRNANVGAVRALLRNGADPRSLLTAGGKIGRGRGRLPEKDSRDGIPIVYPSALQELLCQPTHGPRPGRCPWTYHLSEEDETMDDYLGYDGEDDAGDDNDDDVCFSSIHPPTFRDIAASSSASSVCRDCAADYHIWEPWPATSEEKLVARRRRRSRHHGQIRRLGKRLRTCVRLLLDYGNNRHVNDEGHRPGGGFPAYDDPGLWTALDCFLETFWRLYHPLTVCERRAMTDGGLDFSSNSNCEESALLPPHLLPPITSASNTPISFSSYHTCYGLPSHPALRPFGDICDMLLERAGYHQVNTQTQTQMELEENCDYNTRNNSKSRDMNKKAIVTTMRDGGGAAIERGQARLIALTMDHPQLASFARGEYFDVETQLELALAELK